jgi:trigger factor
VRQLIADNDITLDEARVRAHVEEMCAGYENSDEMVNIYMSNPQIVQQVEPLVLEQMAVDWLTEHGTVKEKKVSFTEYMNS